ncbi:hypothetical protein [Segnochrobactrum spirostomi]|uniref:Uncharacterized protein n=1 Tax=Segnochrobactrum spirostomi TaxID=2608987 RepID=A0A6A7Y207_9HYPH|nr:hypothetical protein [Segnochrobactrum spirostomi]MQT13074.1 hypothetical protein [Segnochrobactrum spirostomi]
MTEHDDTLDFCHFGKWSMPGVPHKGWTCIDIEDLGAPDAVCEMCERQDIRYVPAMQHADYPEILHCGCICAGHMEANVERAAARGGAEECGPAACRLARPQSVAPVAPGQSGHQ